MFTQPGIKSELHVFTFAELSPTARRIICEVRDAYTPETAAEEVMTKSPRAYATLTEAVRQGMDRSTILRRTFGNNLEHCTTPERLRFFPLFALAIDHLTEEIKRQSNRKPADKEYDFLPDNEWDSIPASEY